MKTRSSSQTKKIVLTTDPKEEEVKLGSARTWGREELELLGVKYWKDKPLNLEKKILNVKESEWTQEMRDR